MAWTVLNTTQGRGKRREYAIRLAKYGSDVLAVTFSERMLRSVRWKLGDRIEVLFEDKSGLLGFRWTESEFGRTICSSGGGKRKRSKSGSIRLRVGAEILAKFVNGRVRLLDLDSMILDDDKGIVCVEMIRPMEGC